MSWFSGICHKFWQALCSFFIFIGLKKQTASQSYERQLAIFQANQTRKMLMHYKQIPHARGLMPIIGPLYALITAGGAPKLHLYVHRRHKELGPIFSERLAGGLENIVFVASAELMRNVFTNEGLHPKHPLPDAWTLYNKIHKCQRGLFFMEGKEWHFHRRLLNRFLLNNNMCWANEYIEHCTAQLVNDWEFLANKNPGKPVEISNLQHQLYRWATNVICTIMFGIEHSDSPRIKLAIDEFADNVHKIFESSALLMNFPANLARLLKLQVWTKFEETITQVLSLGAQIIDIFIEQAKATQDVTYSEDTLYNMLCEAGLPLDVIKRIFVDLVIAAGDTTVFTCEWILFILSKDTQVQDDIFKETKLKSTPHCQLVLGLIKEALRLYPVAPFIGRYMAADGLIGDYMIKKDTLVLLSLYTSGRDPAHFPDPLAVKPARWLRNKYTDQLPFVNDPHGTLPFAIGGRSCIGKKIAIHQLTCFIIEVVKKFELSCLNVETIKCILRMVTVPSEPLQLIIKSRNTD